MENEAFVDEESEPNPEWNRITNLIIGAAIAVHKELGPGHLESCYENALAIEFVARNIRFVRQLHFRYCTAARKLARGGLIFWLKT